MICIAEQLLRDPHRPCTKTLKPSPATNADLSSGSTVDIQWRDVRVGQVLQVRDDELFPADLLCIYSALPDRCSAPQGSCTCVKTLAYSSEASLTEKTMLIPLH